MKLITLFHEVLKLDPSMNADGMVPNILYIDSHLMFINLTYEFLSSEKSMGQSPGFLKLLNFKDIIHFSEARNTF